MNLAKKILIVITFLSFFSSVLVSANGGDQRIVEGKYLINLARSPFTPIAGDKTSMLISFVDLKTNKLIPEDLVTKVRIAKLGGSGTQKREFLFEKDELQVKGGVLEFPYTFTETGLHEIFIDFVFASQTERVYESPDFLIDVRNKETKQGISGFVIGFMITSIIGVILGFIVGLWAGQKRIK